MSDAPWPAEEIPDDDDLYVFIHKQWIRRDGRISPGFFQNRPDEQTGAMSVDWSKYSTPDETRRRARQPHLNGVGKLGVGTIRAIPMQAVHHTPIRDHPTLVDNRAHADVTGPKVDTDLDIQDQFARVCTLVLPMADEDGE